MKKLITIFVLVIVCLAAVSCQFSKIDQVVVPPGTAVKGEIVLVDGNFRVNQMPAGDTFLLVWPKEYSRHDEGGETLIFGPEGEVVARVGDIVIIRGVMTSSVGALKNTGPMLTEVSKGPYWWVKDVISSLPESGLLTQERINELAEEYRSRTEFFSWAVYAEEHGITMKEAIGRFSEFDDAGLLGSVLEELEGDTFSGLWLGGSGVVAAFTENGEETIKEYVEEGSSLARRITLRTFEVSFNELRSAQEEFSQLFQSQGFPVSSFTDVVNNRVVLLVTDEGRFRDILENAGVKLPAYVVPDITYEPLDEAPSGLNPDPSVHFPQFKTRSGSFMEALMVGELTLEEGYLRVNGTLIIWQPDYFVHNNNGTIEILDRNGAVVGRAGEEIYMGGGENSKPPENKFLTEPLPEDIEGPFWIQGGGTRLNLNFSSDLFSLEVITYGEDKVYFLKRKPPLDEAARQEITLTGSLVASYNGVLTKYPHIRVEAKPEENKGTVEYTTFWPAGYEARIENGVFKILDGSGRVVLRDGEEAEISGRVIYGYTPQLNDELPGGYSGPYLIVDRILGGKE